MSGRRVARVRSRARHADTGLVSCGRRHPTTAGRAAGPLGGALLVAVVLMLAPAARASSVPDVGGRAASVRAPGCTLPGARTVTGNRHVRVFTAPTFAGQRGVFGCRRTADRAYAIGDRGPECQNYDLIDTAVVAGNLVALNIRTCGLYFSSSQVKLVSLRDGRVRFGSVPQATSPPDDAYDAIRGMVLTTEGRFAWLAVRVRGGTVVGVEVRRRAVGSRGKAVLLDRGASIDWRSLRRTGTRVSWRKAGVVRSAGL